MSEQKSRNAHQTRTIPFHNTKQLIEDIQTLYPAVAQITIIDLDDRDEKYLPKITIRQMNKLSIKKTHTSLYWKKTPRISFSGNWRYIIAVVEKGNSTVKLGRIGMRFED